MVEVLLVDDELLVRSRIRGVMEWEKEGYHIAAECADGTDALEYLRIHNHEIQIVISDIVMTHMNGDVLIARIQELYPHIAAIMLSGYDDFAYVRETLKHGAVDYLLKHDLNREILLDALNRAKKVSSENAERIEPNYDIMEQLQHKFVLNLLSGWYQSRRKSKQI